MEFSSSVGVLNGRKFMGFIKRGNNKLIVVPLSLFLQNDVRVKFEHRGEKR